jgi:uncharacterized phage protein (TIGR02218 family)
MLGDARCGVDLSAPALRATGFVTRVLGPTRFEAALGGGGAQEGFTNGLLSWSDGGNAGSVGPVAADARCGGGRMFALAHAPTATVLVGDGFAVTVGCDRSAVTCRDKFANLLNFRGFPHLPGDDWVGSYPRPGDAADGGSRHG